MEAEGEEGERLEEEEKEEEKEEEGEGEGRGRTEEGEEHSWGLDNATLHYSGRERQQREGEERKVEEREREVREREVREREGVVKRESSLRVLRKNSSRNSACLRVWPGCVVRGR